MSLKSKVFQIILRVICAIFLVLAIFLSIITVVYSINGGNPNIFGSNIYLVKTDAFGFLHSGTAMIARQVPYSEIESKNVVIFNLDNGQPAIAQVTQSRLTDGVYSFDALTENSAQITLSQSQVVAKGMRYSDFWGKIITFAVSPVGMMIIAIVPSIIIIVMEFLRFAGKVMPQPEIETVKKQYEVPTYAPASERKRERAGNAEAMRAYKGSALDDSIGLYDIPAKKSAAERERDEYMESLAGGGDKQPLFTAPAKQQRPVQRPAVSNMPLSQKKLNEAIAATKAEHELEEMKKRREQIVKDIQKTRGAAIAAEKEYETNERRYMQQSLENTGGMADSTAQRASTKTAVMDRIKDQSQFRAQAQAQAQTQYNAQRSRYAQQNAFPQDSQQQSSSNYQMQQQAPSRSAAPAAAAPPRRIQRPALRLGQDDGRQPYPAQRQLGTSGGSTASTTSIPRLDAVLREEDNDHPYNIEEILAGLDRRNT